MRSGLLFVLAAGISLPAMAAPTLELSAVWSDHAVIQRDRPVVVEGRAAPGAVVSARLGADMAEARAGAEGAFALTFPARKASAEPANLKVTSGSESVTVSDLLVGDVWLCSGQSNMEFQLSRALNGGMEVAMSADSSLRLLQVPKTTSYLPERSFGREVRWAVSGPETSGNFSAVCWLMARELRRARGVPIGAVHASWGGSKVTPWLDPEAGAAIGGPQEMALLSLFAKDKLAAVTQFAPRWTAWYSGESGGSTPWTRPDALQWQPVPSIKGWQAWANTPLAAKPTGTVWLRRQVMLTPAQARAGVTLALGVLDDMDTTFVNGQAVGNTFGWDEERAYPVPPKFLKAGVNEVMVAVTNTYGNGGFASAPERLFLTQANGEKVPLGEGWRYAIAPTKTYPPRAPWDANAGIGLMHNRMIAPLGHFAMDGAAWYQGESDVDTADYDRRMKALIAGWRARFGQDLKVGIVQLANYGPASDRPLDSGWARTRDVQRRIVMDDPKAFLATAIDLGERTDIHPANKLLVAQRLAMGAQGRALPMPQVAKVERDAVRVTFSGVEGGLHAWSAAQPIGFELCDAADACRFAPARVEGDAVILSAGGKPAAKVRYAWADNPAVNLFDGRAQAVPGFELAVTPN
ncbi:MAG: sialate O-acetylesterase [Novosphingobium sp.]